MADGGYADESSPAMEQSCAIDLQLAAAVRRVEAKQYQAALEVQLTAMSPLLLILRICRHHLLAG